MLRAGPKSHVGACTPALTLLSRLSPPMKLTTTAMLLALVLLATVALMVPCGALVPKRTHRQRHSSHEVEASQRIDAAEDRPTIPSYLPARAVSSTASFATSLPRRSAAFAVLGLAFADPRSAIAAAVADDEVAAERAAADATAAAEAARERMKQRIAESKKSYRRPAGKTLLAAISVNVALCDFKYNPFAMRSLFPQRMRSLFPQLTQIW